MAADELRLFVAIELSDEVRVALGRLQAELRKRGLEKLRWVRLEGIHLTLKFLGETPPEKAPAIREALALAAQGVPAHELNLGSLGTFGGNNPRVLCVDLKGGLETALGLQQRVDTELAKIGFPREGRAFSPHLTLARVRPETAREMVDPLVEALGAVQPVSAATEVREISLMRSILGRSGAVYERLAAFALEQG